MKWISHERHKKYPGCLKSQDVALLCHFQVPLISCVLGRVGLTANVGAVCSFAQAYHLSDSSRDLHNLHFHMNLLHVLLHCKPKLFHFFIFDSYDAASHLGPYGLPMSNL